jgi:hypothetical protein
MAFAAGGTDLSAGKPFIEIVKSLSTCGTFKNKFVHKFIVTIINRNFTND